MSSSSGRSVASQARVARTVWRTGPGQARAARTGAGQARTRAVLTSRDINWGQQRCQQVLSTHSTWAVLREGGAVHSTTIQYGTALHYSTTASRSNTPPACSRVGPDRVLPASSLTTTWPHGAVEIRTHNHPSSDYPPVSVWTMLQETVARVPDRHALVVKREGELVKWTYTEYLRDIRTVAKGLITLGLKQHHAVCILGHNAPEWHISNIASVISGGLATGIYTTNSSDAVRYVAEHSRANIILVDDEEQLKKVLQVREKLPNLETVIQWGGEPTAPGVISWRQLLEVGRSTPDSVLQERLEKQAVNQPCMLVYTSGTTGNPKGVMISQDNLTWTSRISKEMYSCNMDAEVGVTYLPLSHVAATVIDIYLSAYGGATMWFADKSALQGTLIQTVIEARPTRFFGVPRVWEKIEEKLKEAGKKNSGVKKAVADWAKAAAHEHHTQRMAGQPGGSLKYRLARWLILTRIHAALGLDVASDPVRGGFYSSAAPLSTETFNYFLSLDMPVMELLGSSETGGPQTAALPGPHMREGSVGKAYPHFETKILNPSPDGVGEIVTRGRNVCLGYIWDEEKTRELIDEEGWVHGGDLATQDQDGFFYVKGRMKEIIITGGGENVAPVPIEERMKKELETIISHCMVIGDKRKHLAVIITLRTVLDNNNQPTEQLHPDVLAWLVNLGSSATTARELIREDNLAVRESIEEAIQRGNKFAVSNAAKVHKFLIAPEEFSQQGGELTPTMKVKRHSVLEKYEKQIQTMYELETQTSMW